MARTKQTYATGRDDEERARQAATSQVEGATIVQPTEQAPHAQLEVRARWMDAHAEIWRRRCSAAKAGWGVQVTTVSLDRLTCHRSLARWQQEVRAAPPKAHPKP